MERVGLRRRPRCRPSCRLRPDRGSSRARRSSSSPRATRSWIARTLSSLPNASHPCRCGPGRAPSTRSCRSTRPAGSSAIPRATRGVTPSRYRPVPSHAAHTGADPWTSSSLDRPTCSSGPRPPPVCGPGRRPRDRAAGGSAGATERPGLRPADAGCGDAGAARPGRGGSARDRGRHRRGRDGR